MMEARVPILKQILKVMERMAHLFYKETESDAGSRERLLYTVRSNIGERKFLRNRLENKGGGMVTYNVDE